MEIFRLFGSVFIDNDKANKKIDDTDKKGKGLAGTLGSMIGTAAKVGAGIAAGAAVAGGALFGLSTKAAEATDRVDKLSQKIGLSRKGFQEWDYILGQNGVQVETLQTGLKTITDRLDDLRLGSKIAVDAFGELGMEYEDLKGLSQEEVFEKTIVALQGMEDKTKRAAIASDLFGRSATELAPILNSTTESTEELRKRAHELGLVLGDEAIDAGVKLGDTIDDVKKTFGAFATMVGVGVMPVVQSFLDWVLVHMPEIQFIFGTAFDAISFVVTAAFLIFNQNFLPILQSLYEFVKKYFPAIQDFAVHTFTEIFKIVERLWKLFEISLLPILKALFNWVKPYIPEMGAIIKGAFQVIIDIVNGVITVLEKAVGWFQKAIDKAKEFAEWAKGDPNNPVPDSVFGIDQGYTLRYADGTSSAKRGRHLVGEYGPEIINFEGGEEVIPNYRLKRAFQAPGLTLQIINQGTIVGTTGMEEFADIMSVKMAEKYGFAVGGAW